MKSKDQKERFIIFIDGQNIFHGSIDLDLKFNYKKLLRILRKNKNIVGEYFYSAYDPNNQNQIGFLKMISKFGLTLRTRLLKKHSTGKKKEKGIDIWLSTDLIKFASENKYDTALILAGDGDYIPSIELIISEGKKIELWSWKHALSGDLKRLLLQNNNTVKYIDDIIDKIKMN